MSTLKPSFLQNRNSVLPLFHLAFPMTNLSETRTFYEDLLGCTVGRIADDNSWVDFDFFGHQISAHLEKNPSQNPLSTNSVDSKKVPIRHWGCILEWEHWHQLRDYLNANEIQFIIQPYIRFQNLPGEQATMFFNDPSGNALEFKSFKNPKSIYSTKKMAPE